MMTNEVGKLLTTIPGIGPQTSARIIAAVGNPARFRNGAAFASYLGVAPSAAMMLSTLAAMALFCG